MKKLWYKIPEWIRYPQYWQFAYLEDPAFSYWGWREDFYDGPIFSFGLGRISFCWYYA